MTAEHHTANSNNRSPRRRTSRMLAKLKPTAGTPGASADSIPTDPACGPGIPESAVHDEVASEFMGADEAMPPADAETLDAQPSHSRPKASSKLGIVLDLLEAPEGATLGRLVEITGWLPHTTRAALTGLRKRGFAVTSEKTKADDGTSTSIYRIASATEA